MQTRQLVLENLDLSVAAGREPEETQLIRELAGEVIADESEIIVLLHDVAGSVQPLSLHDLFPHGKSEVVGIDVQGDLLIGRDGAYDIRMTLDGIDVRLLWNEVGLA